MSGVTLKKRGRGRGRGRGKNKQKSSSPFGTLQSSKKKTEATNRINNEISKKQIPLDAQVFSLWADDKDNLHELRISVTATEGLYKGIPLVFEIHIPHKDDAMYPNHQPEVNLVSGYKIIHPNINHDGNTCLGYRRENPWKATMGLKTVAWSILGVLHCPNADNAQEGCKDIAKLMRENVSKFEDAVRKGLQGKTCFDKSWPSADAMKKLSKSVGKPSSKAYFIAGLNAETNTTEGMGYI